MTGTVFSVWPALLRADHPTRPPRPVSVAFTALVVALLAGIGEALTYTLAHLDAGFASLATGLTIRCVIYLVVLAVSIRMAAGVRWARLLLTFGIGVVGLLSLILEPLAATLSANHFSDLFDDLTPTALITATLRTTHILAVLIAIPAMYAPTARHYFRKSAADQR